METVAPKARQENTVPTSGTPRVKFDIPNVEILLPYSAEITKHADVAIGPMKNNSSTSFLSKTMDAGEPSLT
ncbi:hypothetical protein D3C84_1153930 [compost metagenome]